MDEDFDRRVNWEEFVQVSGKNISAIKNVPELNTFTALKVLKVRE